VNDALYQKVSNIGPGLLKDQQWACILHWLSYFNQAEAALNTPSLGSAKIYMAVSQLHLTI
jgi:hypothetical protein